jgi:hypothetical protein
MPAYIDLTGKTFGYLKVLNKVDSSKKHYIHWLCLCNCGVKKIIAGISLKKGVSTSCGCYHRSLVKKMATTHGMARTAENKTWCKMKERCFNPRCKEYKHYGARGITICKRWMKFENFYKDMGDKPSPKHSIERIDNNRGYSPKNCKWATIQEQSKNRRNNVWVEVGGVRAIKSDICHWLRITRSQVDYYRNKLNLSNEESIKLIFEQRTLNAKTKTS